VTKTELLNWLWIKQLYSLAVKTLHNRDTDKFCVVPDSNFYWSAKVCLCNSSSAVERMQVGKLLKQGLITRWHIHYMQIYFDIELAKIAFQYARAFWQSKGLPNSFENGENVIGNYVDPEVLKAWQSECHQLLINNFNCPVQIVKGKGK